tara:strand:+ start:55 stop:372 length:318 start_codon:yes stop_codon:yes gene_type:complete
VTTTGDTCAVSPLVFTQPTEGKKMNARMIATPKQVKEADAAIDAIEAIIDKHGMADVMEMLVHICDEKASHIQHNWQDDELASAWHRVADRLISTSLSNALNGIK